jgi:hypothetical protein
MRKDIDIPQVKNLSMAIVSQYNEEFQCEDWYAYLINTSDKNLDLVLIVSKGFNEDIGKETSLMRHKIESLPAHSAAKVELLQEDLLDKMDNLFNVTYFCESKMYDKQFEFKRGSVNKDSLNTISEVGHPGFRVD